MIGRVFFVLCALLPFCWGVTLEKCPYAQASLPVAFRGAGCDGARCQISLSGNLQFEIDAVAPYDSNYVTPSLMIVLGQDEEGFDDLMPIELPEELGCAGLANGCPVAAQDSVTWGMDIPWSAGSAVVGDTYTIRFTLYDENEFTIACFKTDVDIVA